MNSGKLIIIPDVHGRSFWRDAVKRNPGAEFIFLGDYLDPYPDEGYTDEEAFKGLEDIISFKKENPDRVTLIWGNHDLHYLYPEMMGSRFDIDNAVRNAHKFWDNQELFKMAYEVKAGGKRFLFSHAGICRGWVSTNFPRLEDEDITAELMNDLVGHQEFMSALGDISFDRGGDKPCGSMVWADLRDHLKEDNNIPGMIQVFGHTQMEVPVNYQDKFYCLDCRQAFCLDLEDGQIYELQDYCYLGTCINSLP